MTSSWKNKVIRNFDRYAPQYDFNANTQNAIRISTLVNDSILNAYYARDLTNKIQKQRKNTKIQISDDINIFIELDDKAVKVKAMLETNFKEGILKVAGPFGKNDFTWRGLFILDCASREEAEKHVKTDPSVAAGVFIYDIVPWYGEPSGSFKPGKPENKEGQ